ncbi:MAG: hypothetical protein L3J39_06600 [Verrucomicrobiales bacterium]|nr:hypothetical protein [Verrucomicrobiales bacterium]
MKPRKFAIPPLLFFYASGAIFIGATALIGLLLSSLSPDYYSNEFFDLGAESSFDALILSFFLCLTSVGVFIRSRWMVHFIPVYLFWLTVATFLRSDSHQWISWIGLGGLTIYSAYYIFMDNRVRDYLHKP